MQYRHPLSLVNRAHGEMDKEEVKAGGMISALLCGN
jgi:hypothetical protein